MKVKEIRQLRKGDQVRYHADGLKRPRIITVLSIHYNPGFIKSVSIVGMDGQVFVCQAHELS